MDTFNATSDVQQRSVNRLRNSYLTASLMSLAVLFLAMSLYGWQQLRDQHRVMKETVANEASVLRLALHQQLDLTQAHVYSMQRAVQTHLHQPDVVGEDTLRRIEAAAADSPPDSPWDSLPRAVSANTGSLFLKPTSHRDPTLYRNLLAASVAMMVGVVGSHDRNPALQWSYLLDADETLQTIYPFITRKNFLRSGGFSNMDDMMKSIFEADGTFLVRAVGPKQDPKRDMVWIKPYLDAAGQGMMVTLMAPIYHQDRFVAAVGADITLKSINTVLAQHPMRWGRAVVVDSTGGVVGDGGGSLESAKGRVALTDLFPEQPTSLLASLYANETNLKNEEWTRLSLSNGWTLLIFLPKSVFAKELLAACLNFLLPALALVVWAALLSMYQTRHHVRPAWQLVAYMDRLDSQPNLGLPSVPMAWRHWFERVSKGARERTELMAALQQHSIQLERKVEQRTRDLLRANQALERAQREANAAKQAKVKH